MPEAFATVREVSKRTLGQRHFDVQLMGGAALHWGNIAEMKTGEGKRWSQRSQRISTALEGKASMLSRSMITLRATSLSLWGASPFPGDGNRVHHYRPAAGRGAASKYNADITYGTNNEFGFDYLRDNMAWEK